MAIRHDLPAETWPDEATAAASRWFSPLALGPATARTRTWVPAMVPWRATEDGRVTRDVLDWYGRFAEGRPGVLVVEATGIRDVPSGPLLRIGHDRFVDGLAELVETVRERSGGATRLFIQVIDFLSVKRRPPPEKYFGRFLAVDDALRARLAAALGEGRFESPDETPEEEVRAALLAAPREIVEATLTARQLDELDRGYRETVSDLHLPHVRSLPEVLPPLFADAAARARAAGFDGVELHYAHAYTMAGFLSRRNVRDDGYGGSREGRLRLPLEVLAAVKARVGGEIAVGCRTLTDEIIEGGSRVDDAAAYCVAFARAGIDFLSLSR
ncbi:MAG: NADH:flavin oxidoreductase, partial [Planctomycetota bacterium JB042]